jgi:hypothetical protein
VFSQFRRQRFQRLIIDLFVLTQWHTHRDCLIHLSLPSSDEHLVG